jgi:CBS domain-containing protein
MKIKDRIEFKSKPAVITFSPEDMVMSAIKVMAEKTMVPASLLIKIRSPSEL